ncbi:hypothetical protein [Paenibacillus taiwanensis]|uniref:hypothetical protein n=1 Tax=Paenibacillus taiwanensis TaxID=401638 RepID=UPI0004157622|nr:hypothetical protein [Paenibacillus taiwanensis]
MEGSIVKTMKVGKSVVHICSDYFAQTAEEANKVLEDMHEAGWAIIDKKSELEEAV